MRKYVHLKGRLLALASYVENSAVTADIGCDHGRLCAYLIQNGKAEFVVASDISSDSIKKAEILRDKCGLQARMRICLADGLHGITENPDTIIIAGMGGRLIADIINDCPEAARGAKRLILQPMRGVAQLRKFLCETGYAIEKERLCKEAGRIYQVICAKYVGEPQHFELLPQGFYEIGELMLQENDELLHEYMQKLEHEMQNAIKGAEEHGVELCVLEKKLENIREIMKKLRY